MVSPIVYTTIQSSVLTAISNILAQCITAYRSDKPYTIDWIPVLRFVFFTALSTPPNFLWQEALETTFPGQYLAPTSSALAAAARSDDKALDTSPAVESRLNVTNTLYKFFLDQTVGAAWNTVMFTFVMAGLQGANYEQAWKTTTHDFFPLIRAGWKLWPLVSMVNFSLVKSVSGRQLVGGLAGMGWGIYLSLITGPKKDL